MAEPRRVLIVSRPPVPQDGPALRALAARTDIRLTVAYCGANAGQVHDDGALATVVNPALTTLITGGRWDACIVPGYQAASSWVALAAARYAGAAVLLASETTAIDPEAGAGWKAPLMRALLPRLYDLPDVVIVPSSAARRFVTGLGIAEHRVVLAPKVVDNDGIAAAAAAADRTAWRATWRLPPDGSVALFCGAFLPRKRPLDLLHAFARADVQGAFLVLVGAGPLDAEIRATLKLLKIHQRVRLTGRLPHADVPAALAAADVVVVPSIQERWGLLVNEAMVCGRPVIASDRVGAAGDLVSSETGVVFPAGNVPALAAALMALLTDPARARMMGAAAHARMATWSPAVNAAAVAAAVERAVAVRRGSAA